MVHIYSPVWSSICLLNIEVGREVFGEKMFFTDVFQSYPFSVNSTLEICSSDEGFLIPAMAILFQSMNFCTAMLLLWAWVR